MSFCLFIRAVSGGLVPQQLTALKEKISTVSGLTRMVLHTSDRLTVDDPFIEKQQSPGYLVQLYFDALSSAEAALADNGLLYGWLSAAGGVDNLFCQIMYVRYYLTPGDCQPATVASYMVGYQSQDKLSNLWVGEYLKTHPALLMQLPAVTAVEVYTPVDFYCDYPSIDRFIQRNKVVFNSVDELSASLVSQTRTLLREDYHRLPAIESEATHYPMISLRIPVKE